MSKEWLIPLREVPADDMPIVVGREFGDDGEVVNEGETFYIQEGRVVKFVPVTSMGTIFSTAGLMLSSKPQRGETDEERDRRTGRQMASMEELYTRLSQVIAEWDLVGVDGEPLDQPYRNPSVLMSLTQEELAWLVEQATSSHRATSRSKGKGSRRSGSGSKA